MNNQKKVNHRKIFKFLIVGVCLSIFLFASFKLVNMAVGYYKDWQVMNDVQEKFYDDHSTIAERETVVYDPDSFNQKEEESEPDFEQLLKDNEDVKGWIKIGDTKIDYPILQGADNEAYLKKNYYKEYSPGGSIFLDFRNDIGTLNDNTVIYGHRMKDGSMFEPLMNYTDEDFLEKNPTIELETLNGSYEAEIFSAYKTTTDFNYIQTDFSSDAQYKQFLGKINDNSVIQSNVDVGEDDKIVTLSTCDYDLDPTAGRFAVHAKLVEK